MIFSKRLFSSKVFICYLTVAFSVLSSASSAPAMFVPSPYEGNGENHRETDIQKIQKLLESKLIKHKLSQFGLTKEEIEARLHQLNDEQVHQIASQIHTLEPGGNGAEALLILLFLAIVAIVVLELTGVIDVFK